MGRLVHEGSLAFVGYLLQDFRVRLAAEFIDVIAQTLSLCTLLLKFAFHIAYCPMDVST